MSIRELARRLFCRGAKSRNSAVCHNPPRTQLTVEGFEERVNPTSALSITATGQLSEANAGITATFQITRSETTGILSVGSNMSGTASNGMDYWVSPLIAFFPDGVGSIELTVTAMNDLTVEGTETIIYTIPTSQDYTITGSGSATIELSDDDTNPPPPTLPTVSVSAEGDVSEGGASKVFHISRSETSGPLTVTFALSGTATFGFDYSATGLAVAFGPGVASQDVTIMPQDDLLNEGTETIVLTIPENTTQFTLGAGSATMQLLDRVYVSVANAGGNPIEGGSGKFRITRTGDTTASLDVTFSIWGTASAGTDYTPPAASVIIPAGESYADVTVPILPDNLVDPNEMVSIQITGGGSAYTTTMNANASLTIADDPPVISLSVGNTTEGSVTPGFVGFTRSGGKISEALPLSFSIGGTAINGVDYTWIGASVTIAAGESYAEVAIAALVDNVVEAFNETVTVTMTPNDTYLLAGGAISYMGVVTIIDDAPVVWVEWDADAEEGGSNGAFLFSRSGGDLSGAISAKVAIGGTAMPASDYAMLSTLVNFQATETTVTVSVAAIDDEFVEGDETVTVVVLDGAQNKVGQPASTVVTINDNEGPKVELISADGLKVAKWQDAFLPTVNGKGEVNGVVLKGPDAGSNLDFIDRDPDRFNVWVYDKATWDNKTQHVQAKISTTNATGFTSYNDDATAVDLVRYTGTLRGPGWYWSDSQMLVSNEVDDKFIASTYLREDDMAPGDPGLPKNGYTIGETWKMSDRTHRIALKGVVRAEYVTGNLTVSETGKVDPAKIVKVHATILRSTPEINLGQPVIAEAAAKALLDRANEQFAQVGVLIQSTTQVKDPPNVLV